jgi:hypothetical protein
MRRHVIAISAVVGLVVAACCALPSLKRGLLARNCLANMKFMPVSVLTIDTLGAAQVGADVCAHEQQKALGMAAATARQGAACSSNRTMISENMTTSLSFEGVQPMSISGRPAGVCALFVVDHPDRGSRRSRPQARYSEYAGLSAFL